MVDLFSTLNPEQRRAAETIDGPVLILAGAGSGKTKTLTHRIAHILASHAARPEQIFAVTFTNKAAKEMKERITRLLDEQGMRVPVPPFMGTFHSLCAKILRREIEVLGYTRSFNIADTGDMEKLVKDALKELQLKPDQWKPRMLLEYISRQKGSEITPSQATNTAENFAAEIGAKVYTIYQKRLKESNSLDFDDLLLLTVQLFRQFPDVLGRYQEQFHYIMVDEYQDTNPLQYNLVTLLAARHGNLFVIGDDYQSIYSWRQADIRNILNFEKDYPKAAVITLDQNYRSTQTILDAAQGVIDNNTKQRKKKLWTEGGTGEKIICHQAIDAPDEARFIVDTIEELHQSGRKYGDCAVLYRTNAQSRILEEACLSSGLPYRMVGGLRFYERAEVKDILAYLRYVLNPSDLLALDRLVTVPRRGVGDKSLAEWVDIARSAGVSTLVAAIDHRGSGSPIDRSVGIQKIASLVQIWQNRVQTNEVTLANFIDALIRESGVADHYNDRTEEGDARIENLQELVSVAKKFDEVPLLDAMPAFLEEVALVADADQVDQSADALHLMTIHASKGLEFPVVFVAGLEEGLFPHSRVAMNPSELEEERRLMYVAITRAKHRVYLSRADCRVQYGNSQWNAVSRFIDEIPDELITHQASEGVSDSDGLRYETDPDAAPYNTWGAKKSYGTKGSYGSGYAAKKSSWGGGAAAKKSWTKKAAEPMVPKRMPSGPSKPLASFVDRSSGKLTDPTVSSGGFQAGDMVDHEIFGNGIITAMASGFVTIAFKRVGMKKLLASAAPLRKL